MNQFCMEESEGCSQDNIMFVPIKMDRIGLQLELPDGFYIMEEEKQRRCYPWKGRPDIIMENHSGVQITAQFSGQEMSPDQTRRAAQAVCSLTEEMFPQYGISPVYLCGEGELAVGWFRMEMTDAGTEHIKAISSVNDRMVLLTFTYPAEEAIKWKSIIRQSFRMWRELDGKN